MNNNLAEERRPTFPGVFLGEWTVTRVEAFDVSNCLHREPVVRVGDILSIVEYTDSEKLPHLDSALGEKGLAAAMRADLRASEAGAGRKFVVTNTTAPVQVQWIVRYSRAQQELWANIRLPTAAGIERIVGDELDPRKRRELEPHLRHNRKMTPGDLGAALPANTSAYEWKTLLKKSAYLKNVNERGVTEFGVLNIKYLGEQSTCGRFSEHIHSTPGVTKSIVGIVVNRYHHPGCHWHAEQ